MADTTMAIVNKISSISVRGMQCILATGILDNLSVIPNTPNRISKQQLTFKVNICNLIN